MMSRRDEGNNGISDKEGERRSCSARDEAGSINIRYYQGFDSKIKMVPESSRKHFSFSLFPPG